jgi:sugar lactone lactonase YvrE
MAHYTRPGRHGPRTNHVEQTDGNHQRARFESGWENSLRQRVEHEEAVVLSDRRQQVARSQNGRAVPVSDQSEVDGLRTDVDGRIFLARPSAGKISIITIIPGKDGKRDRTLLNEVLTVGYEPTNLTFGGPDGKTVFVTQKDGKFIEAFRTDRPGREPCLQAPAKC